MHAIFYKCDENATHQPKKKRQTQASTYYKADTNDISVIKFYEEIMYLFLRKYFLTKCKESTILFFFLTCNAYKSLNLQKIMVKNKYNLLPVESQFQSGRKTSIFAYHYFEYTLIAHLHVLLYFHK